MRKILKILLCFFVNTELIAYENLNFYIKKAIENNLQLNAERKKLDSAKQSKNILQ